MASYPLENMLPCTQHHEGYNIDELERLQTHIEAFSETSLETLMNSFVTHANASIKQHEKSSR
jgi:hypothetical protein